MHQTAVGGNDVDRHHVVECQTKPPGQPAEPAAGGEPANSGVRYGAQRGCQAVPLSRPIDGAEQSTASHPHPAGRGVDLDAPHRREVEDHAAVAGRLAREAVTAALDRGEQAMFVCECHRPLEIGIPEGLEDQSRVAVDDGVEHESGRFVAVGFGQQHPAFDSAGEFLDPRPSDRHLAAVAAHGQEVAGILGHDSIDPGQRVSAGNGERQRGTERRANEGSSFHGIPPGLGASSRSYQAHFHVGGYRIVDTWCHGIGPSSSNATTPPVECQPTSPPRHTGGAVATPAKPPGPAL